MKRKYKILHNLIIAKLEDQVIEYMNDGYMPSGGVSIDRSGLFMQAMVLVRPEAASNVAHAERRFIPKEYTEATAENEPLVYNLGARMGMKDESDFDTDAEYIEHLRKNLKHLLGHLEQGGKW